MESNFPKSLKLVLKHEGGWADHPKDPGGATMKGITLATFRQFVKPDATKADLKKITDAQVASVYRRQYWDVVRGSDLPSGVDYAVFDFAVNSGPSRAARYLQEVVGAKVDGLIGPETIKKCLLMKPEDVIHKLCDKRMSFLKGIKTWSTFGKGWTTRVNGVRSSALDLAKNPQEPKPVAVVPEQLDKPLHKTGGFWERVTTIVGLTGITGASWSGDWRVALVIAAFLIVVSAFGLIFQDKIIKAVRNLKAQLS